MLVLAHLYLIIIRIRCSMCSAFGFDVKKISRYTKKYMCKKCGYEW